MALPASFRARRAPPDAATPVVRPSLFEWLFATYGIIVYQDAFLGSLRVYSDDQTAAGEASGSGTASQVALLIGLIIMVWRRRYEVAGVLRDALPMLLVAGLCMLSVLWAIYPMSAFRRAFNLADCVVFGLYVQAVFGADRTLRLIAFVGMVDCVASIVLFLTVPSVGVENDLMVTGAMRGVFAQKNNCADALLVAITCWIYLGLADPKWRMRALLAVAFLFFSIILARSATALIIGFCIITVGAFFAAGRNSNLKLTIGFLAASAVVATLVFCVVDPDVLFALLGRDKTLTGRIPLWQMSIEAWTRYPWLGYGYGSFWIADSTLVQYIWTMLDWEAPSAHCGYIDILLQIGAVGLVLYLWVLGTMIWPLLTFPRHLWGPTTVWVLLFVIVSLTLDMDEGPLPYPDIFDVLTIVSLVYLRQAWRASMPADHARRMPNAAALLSGRLVLPLSRGPR